MPRSLSLTALQVNALTTSDDTILYNAQARDISLYGGTNLASLLTQLEIDNVSGDCLTLRCNGDANNYANFKMNSSGTFDVKINNGNKSFNIVNHNGSTFGLKLNGILVTSTAAELNKLSGYTGTSTNLNYLSGVTPGTASAGKALVTDSSNNLSGINDLSTQNLTVAGTLVTASATELNYTDITTAGTAQAAKALVVDVNRDISNIRNLSATNLTGTLQTASQPNVTSVGTLGSLTVTNQISAGSLSVNGSDIITLIAANDSTSSVTPGTVSASKVLVVDTNKDLTGMGNLTSNGTITASTLAGTLSTASQPNVTTLAGVTSIGASSATTLTGTLATAAQGNITSVGTLTSLTSNGNVDIAEHNGIDKGLQLGGTLVTAAASEINKLTGLTATTTELNKTAGVTPGTVSASKALVVDGNKDLSGIRNITTTGTISGAIGVSATTLTGTLSTASQPNITSVGTLTNLTVSNQITTDIIDAGTILVDGVDITTAISGSDPTTGITPGVVSASKVLLVNSSKNLTGMGNLTSTGTITASTLAGTLSTASQSNITSVGTLTSLTSNGDVNINEHDGSTKGLQLAGTLVTSTASDLNKLAGVTNGTTSASKALVVDSNKDLSAIRNITSTGTVSATTLTGTLSTASQSNITSVGTLTSLTSNNDVNIAQHDGSTKGLKLQGTLVTATAADLNKLSGVTDGTVSSSKVIIADTNKDLSGIRNLTTTGTISGVTTLTATTVSGTLSTASQPNITSVGTLTSLTSNGDVNIAEHDGSTKGLKLAGTLVNATATDLNKLSNVTASATDLNTTTGVTAGTVTASKHLVVDSNKDLTGMGNLTSTGTITAATLSGTTLTGTLSAGAQNNVTTLTGATSVGKNSSTTLTGTLATASQPNVTTLAGVTSIGASNTTTLTGTLATAAQPNVTSVGTLTSLALSGGISGATTISNSSTITNTDTTASSSNSTGAVKLSGGIGISNTTDATSSTNGGTFTTAGGAAIAKKLYVGSDLTVGGNLTISGVTTTINSTTTTINDNTLLLNSGPSGTGFDAGVLTQRYQIDNSAGTGDVVSDTAKESYAISSGTTSTITLPSSASSTNNYYNNWWIKITSGTLINNVRKITAYDGTTKVATLSTVLGSAPSSNDNVNLYNKSYTSLLWNESSKKFVSAFTSNDTSTPGALTIIDYADFTAKNITGTLATAAQPNVTSVGTLTGLTSSGAVSITDSTASTSTTTGALKVTGGLGLAGAAYIGGALNVTGNITGTLATAAQANVTSVGTLTGLTSSGAVSITDSTASTSTTTGALKVTGGAGIAGDLYVGGSINGTYNGTLANLNLNGSLSSTLLTTWNTNSATAANHTAGCWSPELGLFVVLRSASTSTILTSSNGISWTSRSLPSTFTALKDVCWSPELGLFMAVGTSSLITNGTDVVSHYIISSDGISWTQGTVPAVPGLNSVCWSRELKLFIAGSTNGYILYSPNGLSYASNSANWSSAGLPNTLSTSINNVSWSSELGLVFVSYNTSSTTSIYRSSTSLASSWSSCTVPAVTNGYSNITWSKELGYLVATQLTGNAIAYSTTGSTFTAVSSPPTMVGGYNRVEWIPTINAFLAVGGSTATNGNNFSISYNATTWTSSSYTSTYIDVRTCIIWSPDLSLLLLPSSNTSSTYPIISSSQTSNSGLNIISNTVNSISNKLGITAAAQLISSSGIGGTFKWINTLNTNTSNELMRLSKDGYLGINTKTPVRLLHLTAPSSTSTSVIRLTNPANAWTDINIGTDGTISFNTSGTTSGNTNLSGINNLTLGGTSSTLSLSGASSTVTLSNTTASTSSSTGALQVAGGAYFGANSVFNANLTLQGATSTLSLSGVSSVISISNTTASTSSSTGALRVSGGAYFGADSLFGSNVNIGTGTNVSTITSSGIGSTTATDFSIFTGATNGLRMRFAGTSNQIYVNTNTPIGAGNNNNVLVIHDTGLLIGNSNISASSWTTSGIQLRTGVNTYTNSSTASSGTAASAVFNSFARPTLAATNTSVTTTNAATVYIDNSPAAGTNMTITNAYSLWVNTGNSLFGGTLRVMGQSTPTAGEGIEFGYSSSVANIYSYDRTGGTYKNINLNDKMYVKSDGTVGISTNTPSYTLDLGSTAQNMKISLYNGFYGIGACNTNLQSFSDGGFTWHTVDAAVTGNGSAPGTKIGTLYSTGHFEATAGLRATEYAANSYTGSGIEIHYASSLNLGDVFCYDRTNSAYKNLRLNNTIYITSTNNVGIGTTTPTFPLHITTYISSTDTATPAEKFSTSSGGSNWDGTAWGYCSARFSNNIVAMSFIGVSDERIKTNIEEIPIAFCKEFVMNCTPVSYFLKEDVRRGRNNTQFGYIAQDLEKKGFHYLVTHIDNDSNEDLIEIIEDVNGKEYKSPQGTLLSVSYTEIIPLLAQNIKALYLENEDQKNEINELKQKNIDLETRLAKLEAFISTLELAE